MTDVMPSRRERLMAETVAEIKQLAWAQMAEVGPRAVSLRAIARDMGVASSALYRYFPSMEALLGALVTDGFASLADRLEWADEMARADGCDVGQRWLRTSSAHRQWAIENPTAYGLIFGLACEDNGEMIPTAKEEMHRGVNVLFRVMIEGIQSGQMDPSPLQERLTDPMREQLRAWNDELAFDLSEAALSSAIFAWTCLHGTVAAEIFEHLPHVFRPGDVLFDQHMRHVLAVLGYRGNP